MADPKDTPELTRRSLLRGAGALAAGALGGGALVALADPEVQLLDDLARGGEAARVEAAWRLGRRAAGSERVRAALVAATRDRSADVRMHAAWALGCVAPGPRERRSLQALLRDRKLVVRMAAEEALA